MKKKVSASGGPTKLMSLARSGTAMPRLLKAAQKDARMTGAESVTVPFRSNRTAENSSAEPRAGRNDDLVLKDARSRPENSDRTRPAY